MRLGDERGQAIQVGALLLFAFVIIGISIYQAQVVPQQNSQVEFNHYDDIQEDLIRLQADAISVAGGDQTRSSSVTLGTQYPTRIIAINPPPPQGQLKKTLTETNFNTGAGASPPITDLCGGDTTFGIQYPPPYTYLNAQPVTFENGQVFVTGNSGNALLQTRTLINHNTQTIRLYRLDGSVPTRSTVGTVNVELTGSTTIGRASDDEFADQDIFVPTQLSATDWQDELTADYVQFENAGGQIEKSGNQAKITVPSGYTVTCYTVGTGDTDPPAASDYGSGLATTLGGPTPTSTTAEEISYDGGLETGAKKDGDLRFDIKNNGESPAKITKLKATVSSTGDLTEIAQYYRTGNNKDEVEIRPASGTNGFADSGQPKGNPGPSDPATFAIGETVLLDQDAVVNSGSTATVDIRQFRDDSGDTIEFDELSRVENAGDADLTITLTFADSSEKEFYFDGSID